MTTGIYINGVIASDSKVTSGTDINPVFFKKTFAVEGQLMGEKVIGACIAGNALVKNNFMDWLKRGGKKAEYTPFFQAGLSAIVLTDVGVWLYVDGNFIEAWDGCSIGSGGAKATAKFNACKQMNLPCTALDALDAAICPISGDSCSGGMKQWISRTSKGTTGMPATISPDDASKYEVTFS